MYAMRYPALPFTRAVGGAVDAVEDHLGSNSGHQRMMAIRLLLPIYMAPFIWRNKHPRETRAVLAIH